MRMLELSPNSLCPTNRIVAPRARVSMEPEEDHS